MHLFGYSRFCLVPIFLAWSESMGGVLTDPVVVVNLDAGASALQEYRIIFMVRDVMVAHDVPTFKTNDVMYYSKFNHYRKSGGREVRRKPPSTPSTLSVRGIYRSDSVARKCLH